MERRSCVLGVDLGTSALKLVAVSCDGRVIATTRASYRTISTGAGQAEQDCEHWLRALSAASAKVVSRLKPKYRIEAVALTGQMPTLVVLGGNKPLARAITWQDSRADPVVSTRVNDRLRHEIYLKTGIRIDGRYLAPMFHFHYPEKCQTAHVILSAKDFLFYALTGLTVTDPSTASGYGLYNLHAKSWDSDLCKFWKVGKEQLPSLESSSFRAPINKVGSRLLRCTAGTPVVLGCSDSVAGVYAVNGSNPPEKAITVLTGTSTVIMKCDSQPRWDKRRRYLITPFAVDGWYAREADLLATGSAREWASNLLVHNKAIRSLWQKAYRVAPGADGLLFAPYLAGGEQGVLWNPCLRGTLTGLTLNHDAPKVARALLEGMCFEIRRCLEGFEEGADLPSHIRVAGWIAKIPEEAQLLADITGGSVHASALSSPSAIGATLVSGMINCEAFFAKSKALAFDPSEESEPYNQIYAKYVSQFPSVKAS